MSEWGKVPKEAFTDGRLSRTDVRVLGILCAHANGRTGLCTRKQGAIGEELGLSRETVNRAMKKLASLGYVEPRQRAGMKRSLDYRVLVSDGTAGQLGLFDAGAAPRQARPKAAKPRPRCDASVTSVVTPEITSVVTLGVTAIEQTLVNREPVGSAAQREREAVDAEPAGVAETDKLAARLRDAAGGAINAAHPAFLNLSEPFGWLAAGCDLELDIVPVLRGFAGRHTGPPCRTWRYFAGAVAEARDRRLSFATRLPANVVQLRDAHVRSDPQLPAGRFAAAAAHRRRQFAGGPVRSEDGSG